MEIIVALDEGGYLPDKYSKHATRENLRDGYPIISPPITINNVPVETSSLALTFLDFDAVPVGGFVWIHWLAANIPAQKQVKLPANASQSRQLDFIQGRNSNAGALAYQPDPLINQHYVGPQPPDQDHQYQLTVYALRDKLNLQAGYWLNDFYRAIQGEVITTAQLLIPGRV
ncbi:YbhB/YbcL family Raf kinase inhibitor-like protein [Lapidilactobacillus bayanensis]|uniref:YbhB/YbcL family Raf kinase inhibitor-like protein n=1 Tax=Lapidilactobacillus bayanensis TaxID=2485998 RepID=UPI000F7A3BE4|nr:YbhB/YbcL family Raf kinase inhibitor-like protein [Lapidilactobacillus bayanensis]